LQKRFPWVDVFSAPSDPQPLLDFLSNRQQADQAQSWRMQIDSMLDEEFVVAVPGEKRAVSENLR
jgi:hypothetical protein